MLYSVANPSCQTQCCRARKRKAHSLLDLSDEDMRLYCSVKRDDGSRSAAALRYIHKGLNLSSSEMEKLRRERTESLVREKKLILILDLDNTLLHTVLQASLTHEEECLVAWSEYDPNKTTFVWNNAVTKLRPFVHRFLEEASDMYEMYIYTMGSKSYAMRMAGLLDPEGIYFESKIISREDNSHPGRKGLDIVVGEERMVVIVDDKAHAWGVDRKRVFQVPGYVFFGTERSLWELDQNAVPQFIRDEQESTGVLVATLRRLTNIHRNFFDVHPSAASSSS